MDRRGHWRIISAVSDDELTGKISVPGFLPARLLLGQFQDGHSVVTPTIALPKNPGTRAAAGRPYSCGIGRACRGELRSPAFSPGADTCGKVAPYAGDHGSPTGAKLKSPAGGTCHFFQWQVPRTTHERALPRYCAPTENEIWDALQNPCNTPHISCLHQATLSPSQALRWEV